MPGLLPRNAYADRDTWIGAIRDRGYLVPGNRVLGKIIAMDHKGPGRCFREEIDYGQLDRYPSYYEKLWKIHAPKCQDEMMICDKWTLAALSDHKLGY